MNRGTDNTQIDDGKLGFIWPDVIAIGKSNFFEARTV
jgi:hypothetical protein